MKVDRRSFLGLGLGAAAGVAVSPVGIKLTDDSSIWTQNWPWTPVPKDGEISYDSSVCSICPGNCGISIRKIDKRPVKIEGQEGYPVNDGGACLHGIAGLQYLYDPARVRQPLKKTGDTFQPISWDEAITLMSDKLAVIRDKAPERLVCIGDKNTGSVPGLFKHFLTAFGSPNYYAMPGLSTYLELTAQTLHGAGYTLGFDLENADFVLSFGAGIIEGWGSPVSCFKANASRKERHAKLYQIEPRLSNTAANADKWIPVTPGSEGDLALSMCGVLLGKNLFDSGFAANFRGGFNKFVAMVRNEYAPEKVAAATGISAEDIEKTALMFARAKAPVAVPGKGRGAGAQSLKEFAAIHVLNCLTGNINKKGGVFVMPQDEYLSFPDPVMDEIAEAGAGKDKLAGSVSDLVARLNKASSPAVEGLLVYNANPCYTLNNPKEVKQAFEKIPFVAAFSSFLDETAMAADLVLPMSTFLEKTEDVPPSPGLSKSIIGLGRQIIDPVFHSKSPGDALILLANGLEGSIAESFEWDSYSDCLESLAADVWDTLSEEGHLVVSEEPPAGLPGVDFSFLSDNPETMEPQGDGPLILVPIDNMRLTQSVPASSPFAVKTVSDRILSGKDILVEVNPATAKGFKDQSLATLTTPAGSARVRINLNEGIMPGVIGMARGLGHTFDNKFVSNKGVNVNELIGPVIEAGSGLDAAFGIRAKLS
ncbi:menaquinone reductase molybdopterin-binding-like subunit QrcB [Desulfospira joergensenii]|uniref:menaquinone reductase molybdopterin-binding-like subunit QrcB n=1 Tax=Desulfospira joergensenii TaxID=53329 RepID=UPI00040DFB1A|nr:menaquinone reductase molybdopterin-binding-like subunit QrcB [Desulfospira joergensenii]